jgi:hypothetical protein
MSALLVSICMKKLARSQSAIELHIVQWSAMVCTAAGFTRSVLVRYSAASFALAWLGSAETRLIHLWRQAFADETQDFLRLIKASIAVEEAAVHLCNAQKHAQVPNLGMIALPDHASTDPGERRVLKIAQLSVQQVQSFEAMREHGAAHNLRKEVGLEIKDRRAQLDTKWRANVRGPSAWHVCMLEVSACMLQLEGVEGDMLGGSGSRRSWQDHTCGA